MIDFFRRLFGQPGSSAMAKERLRLVLMTDHLELAPELIESMKRDLVDVIGRYVEVDREKIEVNFERQDKALAMLANIPILSVNRPNGNGANGAHGNGAQSNGSHVALELQPAQAPEPQQTLPPPRSRKRRKRAQKKAATGGVTPAPVAAN